MIGSLAKAYAYTKAPRTTFTTLHPFKALRLRKLKSDLKHSDATRIAAAGAALVALPLGIWLGRRSNGNGSHERDA